MQVKKITKSVVDSLEIRAKQYWIWDGQITGFGIVVRPTGNHSFVLSYNNAQGRKKNFTLAKVGQLTTEEARKLAEKKRLEILNGSDPLAEKTKTRLASTVSELIDQYLESDAFRNKASSTQSTDLGRIKNHIRPLVGDQLIDDLNVQLLERMHRKIANGLTAKSRKTPKRHGKSIVRGGRGAAKKSMALLRKVLNWGNTRGLVQDVQANLISKIELGADGNRTSILETGEHYRALFDALDRLTDPDKIGVDEEAISFAAADAIRVIALTGARRGEITKLQCKHIDPQRGVIVLPPSAHKTGTRTGQNRIIGLPELALELIEKQPSDEPDDYVFHTGNSKRPLDLSKPWRRVRIAAGLSDDFVLHTLRHSFASHMAMNGAAGPEIMAALGHRDIATSQKYIHFAENRHKQIADKASAHILKAIE